MKEKSKQICSGSGCAIVTCNNYRGKTGDRISYHRFPKDKFLHDEWKSRCKRADFATKNYYVCGDHFTPDDYERDLRNELLGLPLRNLLKKGAIPTLNLPSLMPQVNNSHIQRSKKSVRKIPQKNKRLSIGVLEENTKYAELEQQNNTTANSSRNIENIHDIKLCDEESPDDNFNETMDTDHLKCCGHENIVKMLTEENALLEKKFSDCDYVAKILREENELLKIEIHSLKSQISILLSTSSISKV